MKQLKNSIQEKLIINKNIKPNLSSEQYKQIAEDIMDYLLVKKYRGYKVIKKWVEDNNVLNYEVCTEEDTLDRIIDHNLYTDEMIKKATIKTFDECEKLLIKSKLLWDDDQALYGNFKMISSTSWIGNIFIVKK